jgi:D-alanyl-lipoteichoic acid acyltransferase DltB (MBOAT superfamily)
MDLLSLEHAAVVGLAVCIYHATPERWRVRFLLLVSYGWYGAAAPRFLPVLLLITAIAIVVGNRMTSDRSASRRWLIAGIACSLALLAGLRWWYVPPGFAVPFVVVGLSFYSLQAVSYMIDRYNRTVDRPLEIVELALFLAYFPKIAAGPIERAAPFAAQLRHPKPVDDQVAGRAATLIAVGLTRKLVIADPLMQGLSATGDGALGAAALILRFVFALYNDFAGYTEIVRGVSLLFGIELSANFARPFFATSFSDLWNRWHITLTHWLRDYVFLPLSRALLRRGPRIGTAANLTLPPLATMLASGLWHGANPHMLLWGAINGVYLAGERALWLARRQPPAAHGRHAWRLGTRLTVFALTCIAFVFFRMPVSEAMQTFATLLFGPTGSAPWHGLVVLMSFSLYLDSLQARRGDEHTFDHWPRALRAAALALAMLLWFLLTREAAPEPFVYQGF